MVKPALNPAPPGVIPNYVNPPSIGYEITVVGVTTGAFALIAVIARLISKIFITKSIGWDDYYSVLAMTFAVGRIVCGCMMTVYGTGRHIWDVPLRRATKTAAYLDAINVLYLWAIMFAKLSILALYIRIFGVHRTFEKTAWLVGAIIVFYCIACTPMYILACIPGGARSFAQIQANQCVPYLGLSIAVGAINIATDTVLLVLPVPMLVRLQMSTGRKIAMLFVFGTGLVAWSASVVREVLFVQHVHNTDATWTQVPDIVWLTVEMNVGILAGCLPVLLPLVHRASQLEGLKSYIFSLASHSSILRKNWSKARIHSPTASETRDSESLKAERTSSEVKRDDEEKILPNVTSEEPWFTQQQAKVDTARALNEKY